MSLFSDYLAIFKVIREPESFLYYSLLFQFLHGEGNKALYRADTLLKKLHKQLQNNDNKMKTHFAFQCINTSRVHFILTCNLGLITELLEFSEDRNPWESVEEKLNAIR